MQNIKKKIQVLELFINITASSIKMGIINYMKKDVDISNLDLLALVELLRELAENKPVTNITEKIESLEVINEINRITLDKSESMQLNEVGKRHFIDDLKVLKELTRDLRKLSFETYN